MKILGIAGSIRSESYNRKLLLAAQELAPDGVTIEIHDLGDIPLYNADDDGEHQPEPVVRLKNAISDADALLIACPEYNASFSGVLKNAIDWVSRPSATTPLIDKPAAIMGASGGPSATIRAQAALPPVLNICGVRVMPKPSVAVRFAAQQFDESGRLTDQDTRNQISKQLVSLVEFATRLNAYVPAR